MTLSSNDAAAALHDIEQAEARSATLADYQQAAPHFLIWGALWIAGYATSSFLPTHTGAVWAAIVPIGIAASFAAMRGSKRGLGWRYGAVVAAVSAVIAATFLVMAPVSPRQVAAF